MQEIDNCIPEENSKGDRKSRSKNHKYVLLNGTLRVATQQFSTKPHDSKALNASRERSATAQKCEQSLAQARKNTNLLLKPTEFQRLFSLENTNQCILN